MTLREKGKLQCLSRFCIPWLGKMLCNWCQKSPGQYSCNRNCSTKFLLLNPVGNLSCYLAECCGTNKMHPIVPNMVFSQYLQFKVEFRDEFSMVFIPKLWWFYRITLHLPLFSYKVLGETLYSLRGSFKWSQFYELSKQNG